MCAHDCRVPLAMQSVEGREIASPYRSPTVNHSDLPALLGLKALIDQRCSLDLRNMTVVMIGLGETD